jgi:hypothetical protein
MMLKMSLLMGKRTWPQWTHMEQVGEADPLLLLVDWNLVAD